MLNDTTFAKAYAAAQEYCVKHGHELRQGPPRKRCSGTVVDLMFPCLEGIWSSDNWRAEVAVSLWSDGWIGSILHLSLVTE